MAKTIKSYVYSYVNQLDKFPEGIPQDVDAFKRYVLEKLEPEKFCFIIHDRDKSSLLDKEFVEPHMHLVVRFSSKRHLNAVAKAFGDVPEHFEPSNSFNNSACYLVHATDTARKEGKFQYPLSDVISSVNIDYPALVESVARQVKKSDVKQIEDHVRRYANREISKKELRVLIADDYEFARLEPDLKKIEKLHVDDDYEAFINEMEEKNMSIEVIFIAGNTGVGKSSFSRDYSLNVLNEKPYVAQTAKNIFDDYEQEKCLIIDEATPNDLPTKEWLLLLDNHKVDKRVSARYRHRALVAHTIILNYRKNVADFWEEIKDEGKGSSSQFYRRLSKIYYFEDDQYYRLYFKNLTAQEYQEMKNSEEEFTIYNAEEVENLYACALAKNDLTTRIPVLVASDFSYENIYTKKNQSDSLFDHQQANLDEDLSALRGHSRRSK